MGREIEVKLILKNGLQKRAEVEKVIESLLIKESGCFGSWKGVYIDYYWKSPEHSKADFVRIRKTYDRVTLTVKVSDKGTTFDRKEVETELSDPEQGLEAIKIIFGAPLGVIVKKCKNYQLSVMGDFRNGHSICLYEIEGCPELFIEIEAKDPITPIRLSKAINQELKGELKKVMNSHFDIFVKKNPIVEAEI